MSTNRSLLNCLYNLLFIIENGIVTLAVDGEFEVKLGITSDNLFAPWHVYKTKLFLRDPEEPGIDHFLLFFKKKTNIFLFLFIEQELIHTSQVNQKNYSLKSIQNFSL